MTQWYYAKNGQQLGPVTLDQIRQLASSGQLDSKDLVWNSSMKDWLPAGTVAVIFDGITPSSNPYAAPVSGFAGDEQRISDTPLTEIEPGSDPIEVGTCVSRGFDLTKRNFAILGLALLVYVAISIGVSIPFTIAESIAMAQQATPPIPRVPGDVTTEIQRSITAQFTPLYFVHQVVSTIVSSFLMAGFLRICLNIVSGAPVSVGMLFGQGNKLPRLVGISVLLAVPMWIVLGSVSYLSLPVAGVFAIVMVILNVVLWLRLGFSGMAVVDRDLGFVDSLKYSASITRNNQFRIFGLGIITVLLVILGAIACGVGIFFTLPLSIVAGTVAYRWMQYGRAVIYDVPGSAALRPK